MFNFKRLCLAILCLSLSACILYEGELMEVNGRWEKVYKDFKGRSYYVRKGHKHYLDEANSVKNIDFDKKIQDEANQFDNEY